MSHGFPRICTDSIDACPIDLLSMASLPLGLKHSDLTQKIIGVFYDVYNELGHGFLESTYADAMLMALLEAGMIAEREVSIPVWFRGRKVGQYYADLIVEGVILIELKAVRALEAAHEAQILHYLRATEIEVGLLINFGLRPQFRRFLFDNERKKTRDNSRKSVAEVEP